MNAPEEQRCEVVGAPSGWPALRVLVVAHSPSADLGEGRDAARQRVRALLLRDAGPEIAAPFLAIERAAGGACRASISHEQSHSMLAWCERGRIGIDTINPQRLADMDLPSLAAVAALYLGPKASAAVSSSNEASQARRLFADAWARHEARLKCLGLSLDEWSPELQAQLASCLTALVSPPPREHASLAGSVTRIAWRN